MLIHVNFQPDPQPKPFSGGGRPELIPRVGLNFQLKSWP